MNMYGGTRLAVLLFALTVAVAGCTRQPEQEARLDTDMQTTEQRSDISVTTAVQARLYADDMLRGGDIDVSTENGVVTLRGTVESEQARQHALMVARGAEGATQVQDQLTIQASADAENRTNDRAVATSGDAYDDANPAWITTKIQAQYFVDPDVKPWNIDVTTTSGGIVELRGEVESTDARMEAVRIARETDGVNRVEDRLRVRAEADDTRSGDTMARADADADADRTDANRNFMDDTSDAWLTTKVQSKYFLDTDVKGRDIDVTTQNGVVTLRGSVESASQRRQAVALARNTDGVSEVRDELRIQAEADADASTQDRADASRQEQARGTTGTDVTGQIEDTWITTKVQSQYFLDNEVKGHEINVDTNNGVVTLTGTVETDARKQLAEEIARETDGVSRVVNRLTIGPDAQDAQQGAEQRQQPSQQ